MNISRWNLPEEAIAAIREQLQAIGLNATTTDMSVETIKNFCLHLNSHNVVQVNATYDGSGDSGDLHVRFVVETTHQPAGHHEPRTQRQNISEHEMGQRLQAGDRPLVTGSMFAEFIDSLWALLPGGWEIDDGSYGEIIVDVVPQRITVEHNERYTEVRSSTEQF